ncbi:fungal fatty acid synthase subunit beta [Microdochium nivale]|nr:fungal fatty acid synthase subunit beta [Microdochium nivale]
MARTDTPPPECGDGSLAQADGDRSPPRAEQRLHGHDANLESKFDKIRMADSRFHSRPVSPPDSTSPLLDDHLELLTAFRAALQDSAAPPSNSCGNSPPESHPDLQHDASRSLVAEIDDNVLAGANVHAAASALQVLDDEKPPIVQSFNAARHAAGLEVIPQQHFASLTAIAGGGNRPLGEATPACAIFGGQGLRGDRVQELGELAQTYSSLINDLLEDAAELLAELSQTDAATRQHCHRGLDVLTWLRHPEQAPDAAYIRSAPVSAPLIGLVQLLQYAATCRTLDLTPGEFSTGLLSATTGHSQGIVTAAAVASATDWLSYRQAMRTALTTLFWIGVRTQQVWDSSSLSSSRGEGGSRQSVSAAMLQDALDHDERAPSPMLSVRGLSRTSLQGCLRAANRYLGVAARGTAAEDYHSTNAGQLQQQQRNSPCGGWLEICMVNGPQQFVVSGPPRHLYGLNLQIRKAKQLLLLQVDSGDDDDDKAAAAAAALPSSKFLDVSAPFHSAHVGAAVALVVRDVAHLGISRAALAVPVLGTEQGEEGLVDPGADNILALLVELAVSSKVDWARTMQAATATAGGARVMLDFGPGGVNGIGSLAQENKTTSTTTSVVVGAWSGRRPELRHRGDVYAWAQGNPWK